MTTTPRQDAAEPDAGRYDGAAAVEHVDVVIIGAGISGIGAAYHLQRDHPDKTFTILEAREAIGGTWDLFRYPGIRSDSDLHTFSYDFKPWRDDDSIAGADKILAYLHETAAENGIDRQIRLGHRVNAASWSTAHARWTIDIEQTDVGDDVPAQENLSASSRTTRITANWIFSATGYYRYDEGYTPHFPGREDFTGTIVHPQHWPEDLDHEGKRVVVIGSGATAVTLIPALAPTAAHVTMLQRSPTYVIPLMSKDPVAKVFRTVLGEKRGHTATRWKNVLQQYALWSVSQRFPSVVRKAIRAINARALPAGYPVDVHFNPTYNPWDQRLCVVPDGDLFKAIRSGDASVVTDHITRFTATGVELVSGDHLDADIIVTATGLNLQAFGAIEVYVDGARVDLSDTVAYKGMMLSGIPNFAFAIGYTNSSWTLKVGLLCEHFSRLLDHMDAQGYDICRAELPDPHMGTRPLLDFGAGYVQRAIDDLPRQGTGAPWLMSMSYLSDVKLLKNGPVADANLRFGKASHSDK